MTVESRMSQPVSPWLLGALTTLLLTLLLGIGTAFNSRLNKLEDKAIENAITRSDVIGIVTRLDRIESKVDKRNGR